MALKRITSPAAPGNTLALKHGAYSPAAIEVAAQAVHDELLVHAPWLNEPQYFPSLDRYLKATARERLAHDAIVAAGAKVSPRLLEAASSAARLAWQMGEQLGLTPAGHARLRSLAASAELAGITLAAVMAEGREARIAAERRFAADGSQVAAETLDIFESDDEDGGSL